MLCRHTHFGVDQVFSRHSSLLRRKEAQTAIELAEILSDSYSPTPDIRLLTEAADVKEWLSEHMNKSFQGITEGYQFLIENVDGETYVRDKMFSVVESYREGAVLLKSVPPGQPGRAVRRHLFFSHPKKVEGVANLSKTERAEREEAQKRASVLKAEESFTALKRNVKRLFVMSLMNKSQYDWWQRVITKQETTDWSSTGRWLFRFILVTGSLLILINLLTPFIFLR